MITKLTKSQQSQVPKYLKKWFRVGNRTKVIDKRKARKAVDFLYTEIMGIPKPKYFVILDSPMACQLALNYLDPSQKQIQLDTQLGTQLDTQLRTQLGTQLGTQLDTQLNTQLYTQLRTQLRTQLDTQLGTQLDTQLDTQLRTQLDTQLGTQLDTQLNTQLRTQLDTQLRTQLDTQLGTQLDTQLRTQLGTQLRAQLDTQLGAQLYTQLYTQLDTQLDTQQLKWFNVGFCQWWWGYWCPYYGFYDYIINVLFKNRRKEFKKFQQYTKHIQELHYCWLMPDFAVICDFPKEVNLNKRNQLHSLTKPALLYRDTYALYASNGVRVTKEFVETKPDAFTREMITKEKNADIRREIVRKVGNERLLTLLGYKVLDKQDGYELISYDIGDGRVRPFLKMVNPSMKGVIHIEGVLPEINTVKDAIMYRNGLTEFTKPEELT